MGTMKSGTHVLSGATIGVTAIAKMGVSQAQVGNFEDFVMAIDIGRCFAYSTDQVVHSGQVELRVLFTPNMTEIDRLIVFTYLTRQSLFQSVTKQQ